MTYENISNIMFKTYDSMTDDIYYVKLTYEKKTKIQPPQNDVVIGAIGKKNRVLIGSPTTRVYQ